MRIDAYNQINAVYETKQKARAQQAKKTGSRDEVYISSAGKDYQAARQAIALAPEIRKDKVASLKAQIDAGTYQVSGESFAAKLIARYEENQL